MAANDFATINGQYVRITSFTRDDDRGSLSLVVIVRGNAARDEVQALLRSQPLSVAMGDGEAAAMRVADIDLRSSGEGARTIHRFAITLKPDDTHEHPAPPPEPSGPSALMERLDAIERKLDRILSLLAPEP